MAATQTVPRPLRWARSPFYFNSSAQLIRIGRLRATTLGEFSVMLQTCPDDAIFQHTFQTLREHHYLREGFTNDFAHWIFSACNEVGLAEQLAAVDVREYTSIRALRTQLVKIIQEYLDKNPHSRERAAFEPFYFCATDSVVIPTPFVARNLAEFADGLRQVSLHSVHYHYIEARVRLKLNSNDFSLWMEEELDLLSLADRINRIDIYTSTLEDVRQRILRIVQTAL
jgi:hypothetical protein